MHAGERTSLTSGRRSTHVRRRLGALLALLAVCTACTSGGPAEPNPAQSPSSSTEPVGRTTRGVAAPADCLTNPYCAPGMRHRYGIDISAAVQATNDAAVATTVETGDALVGVLFSTSPAFHQLTERGLVALPDDQQMQGAENVVPFATQRDLERLGSGFTDTVDQVSAALQAEDIAELIEQGAGNASIAAWVAEHGPFPPGSGAAVVGAMPFRENRVLAQLYAGALDSAGFEASVEDVDGFRGNLWDSVVFGDVTLGIDYAASALEYLSGYQNVATGDGERTLELLRTAAGLRDAAVLEAAPATSRNEFIMRAEDAERLGVSQLSDLAKVFPRVEPGADVSEPVLTLGSSPSDPGIGTTGERVVRLEERLLDLGYRPGPADGEYDARTVAAVTAFQRCQGLALDGVVGPATQAALDEPAPCDPEASPAPSAESSATDSAPDPSSSSAPDSATDPAQSPSADRGRRRSAGPIVYLTFDDGPHPTYTPQILDVLARNSARGTFFEIGESVHAFPALTRRVVAAGHLVGNHTWHHADLSKASHASFLSEVSSTTTALKKAGVPAVRCLRPPYGARNHDVDRWTRELGLIEELWTVDPQDWRRPGTSSIVRNVLDNARDGSIVLMHDGGGNREQSVAALKQILPALKARGYRFATLPC